MEDYHKAYRGERPSSREVMNLISHPMAMSIEYRGWDIMFAGWRDQFDSFRTLAAWVASTRKLSGMWVSTTEGSCRYYDSKLDPFDVQGESVGVGGGVVTPWTNNSDRSLFVSAALITLLDKLDTQPKPGA